MTTAEAYRLASFGLVVLIWLVQTIIYPAFGYVEPDRFVRWHERYTRAVTWIVAPLMLGQAGLLARLVATRPGLWTYLGLVAVACAWAATFALAVPAHERLQAHGRDPEVVRRLVATNWIRTIAWTAAFLFATLGPAA